MLNRVLLASFCVFVGAGCSEIVTDDGAESTVSDLTQTSDQSGTDVQVLQVWTPGRLFPKKIDPWFGARPGDVALDADAKCDAQGTSTWSHWEDKKVDCTRALGEAAPFDVTGKAGPVMTPVRFTVTRDIGATGSAPAPVYVDPDYCNFVELRLVARSAAVGSPAFAGIGFYTSKGDSFAPKSELQEVGRTRLANGDDAIVYRFSGISTCISSAHNSTSGNIYQTFSFKPYAAYDVAQPNGDTRRYRIWERIDGNHTLGRSWPEARPLVDASGFDRQNELLAR